MRMIMRDFDREKKAFGTHEHDVEIRLPHPLAEATIGNVVHGGLLHISRYSSWLRFWEL